MRALEAIVAIFCAVIIVFTIPYVVKAQETANSLRLCAEEGVDRMIADIKSDGEMTLLRMDELTKLLMDCGYSGEFAVSVSVYEDSMDGVLHEYVVSWEEILEVLQTGQPYCLPENCYGTILVKGLYPNSLLYELLFARTGFSKPFIMGSGA